VFSPSREHPPSEKRKTGRNRQKKKMREECDVGVLGRDGSNIPEEIQKKEKSEGKEKKTEN